MHGSISSGSRRSQLQQLSRELKSGGQSRAGPWRLRAEVNFACQNDACKTLLHSTKMRSKLGWLKQDKKASTYLSNHLLKRAKTKRTKMMQSVKDLAGLQSTTLINDTLMLVRSIASQVSWDRKCHREDHQLRPPKYPTTLPRHHHRNMPKHLHDRHLQRLE